MAKQPAVETCGNCGRVIGKLETPMVWKESVVCAACYKVLEDAALLARASLLDLGKWSGECGEHRYTTANAMFRDLRTAMGDGAVVSEREIFRHYADAGLLVVDELGELKLSDFEVRRITELVDERYGGERPTVLVGNGTRESFSAMLGPSIVSRANEVGLVIDTTGWPNFRAARGGGGKG